MKHATLFSCFILGLPRPFPPHAWEPWSTQTLFHASFCAFPSPSHPTLGTVNLFLMLQTLPTPLLGTMRNTHPLFHVPLKGVGSSAAAIAFVDQRNLQQQKFPSFSPHSWEPWAHHTLRNHDPDDPENMIPMIVKSNAESTKTIAAALDPTPSWIHYMNSGFRSPLLRYYIILYYIILYYIILYYNIMYYIILYYIMLYYIHSHTVRYIYIHLRTFTYRYVHLHTLAHIYIHLHTFTYIYIHLRTFAYIYIHCTFTYICIHLHTLLYVYVHLHNFTYIYIHLLAYICIQLRTLSHMYIHVHTLSYFVCLHTFIYICARTHVHTLLCGN